MRITETMGPAWETTKRLLFRPFNIGTWFSFGFIFFLQSCMEGGGSNGLNIPRGLRDAGRTGGEDTGNAIHRITGNIAGGISDPTQEVIDGLGTEVIVGIAIVMLVLFIPLVLLFVWLGTRGQMMAIRSVATANADIGTAWNTTKDAGARLFKFHLAVMAVLWVLLLPLLGGAFVVALPVIRHEAEIESIAAALVGFVLVLLVIVVPFFIVTAMARNFVAPIMLKDGSGAREAWKRFWSFGRHHVGAIILFLLLRAVIGFGAGIMGVIASFMTCCLGFLPVLHQTLMAPYYVFERAWTLEALASLSPELDLRTPHQPPPPPFPPQGGFNPYAGAPTTNPYAPPGYGGSGYGPGGGGPSGGGYGGPPPM